MRATDVSGQEPRPAVTFSYRLGRARPAVVRLEALDAEDHIFRTIRQTGTFYESDLLWYLSMIHRPVGRSVIIDVGANIGNHSVFFARHLACHVIAVEPNPALLPVLTANLEANIGNSSRWSVVGAAVGASAGFGLLEPASPSLRNVGMSRVRDGAGPGAGAGPHVRVTTLDQVVEDFYQRGSPAAPIGLIKVDVEGMEAAVLEGAREVLERFGPDLVVEAKDEGERGTVEEVIGPLGYIAVSTHCATPTHHYVREPAVGLVARGRLYRLRRWLTGRIRGLLHEGMRVQASGKRA